MANDINKEDPHYKGEYGSIYEVNRKFPTGGVAGDFVVIEGWAHYWNADRGTWCVNAERDSYWDELITNIIEKFKLVRGATYMGIANLDSVPAKVIGAKMYYFATVAGTYKNFGDLVVPQGINVLYSENGSSWVNTTLLELAQELGVSTNKVVSQKTLNDALAKKFDKESVVQESGEAKDKVMSQKAVSDKLSDLASFTKMSVPFTQGAYYTSNGELSTAEWAAHAEFDVSDKNGLYLHYTGIVKKDSDVRCGFKDREGNVISTFVTSKNANVSTDVFVLVPSEAKTCFLSSQSNITDKYGVLGFIQSFNNNFMFRVESGYSITETNNAFDFIFKDVRINLTDNYNIAIKRKKYTINNNSVLGVDLNLLQEDMELEAISWNDYCRRNDFAALLIALNGSCDFSCHVIGVGSKNQVPFTQGAYYNNNGELSTAAWASHAEFDVSDKNGLYLIARLCALRYVLYCGFKDSDGNIISTFGSIDYDNPLRMDSIVIEKIPDGAKTCYLSTQENSKIFKPCVLGYISNNAFMKELEQKKVPKVIIDTDFMTDVDDAIAIRLACNLESWGKMNILGINISEKNEDSAIAMSAFLKDMGRGDIPISLNKNAASESSRYLSVCRDFPTDIYGNYGVEQSVDMYYRILSSLSQYDKCSIICIGHLTNVKEVMVKYPALFARKVEKIYLMGGNFNGGNKEYNISGTTGTGSANSAVVADSKYVIENAKCKIVFSPFEYGAFIHTGSSLYNNGKTDDMLYKMLNAFSTDVAQNGKQTWDGTTVLFAAQNNESTSYSTQFLRGIVTLSDTGVTTFKEDANGNHYIALFNNRKSVIRSIEKLIDSKLLFENFGSYLPKRLVKQVYTGAEKIELAIQHGVYYNKNGEQNNVNWAISGIANIASYAGRYIYVECSCHSDYVYCGFKDSDGKVISTFQTDTSEEGERTIFRGSIPLNATSIFISSQYDYVPIIKCYAHF